MFAMVAVFAGGCASTGGSSARVAPSPGTASTTATAGRDTHEGLNGVLWVQTSAEFWALTTATYHSAQVLLERALTDKSWSAALEQPSASENLPPAVILDIDETVLDNSPAQAQMALERTVYQQDSVERLGRKDGCRGHSGRSVVYRVCRKAWRQGVLRHKPRGFRASGHLEEPDGTGHCGVRRNDSQPGRERVDVRQNGPASRDCQVASCAASVGDDMNDFVSTAKLTPPQRVELATKHADRWGRSWILLPNPMYGSWERALYAGLTRDEDILRRKREVLKGFRP